MDETKFSKLRERYRKDSTCRLSQAEVEECTMKQCIELDNLRREKMRGSIRGNIPEEDGQEEFVDGEG